MMHPVVCTHCGAVYDLCATERIARHADCDVFKAPCCGQTADTRKWKSMPDYREFSQENLFPMTDYNGVIVKARVIDPEETMAAIRAEESKG